MTEEKVKSNLSRFVVIVWLFAVLVLTSSYTASLTSMLTVQQLDPADIRDLTRKGEYIGYKNGSFMRSVLESTNSDKLKIYTSFEEYDDGLTLGSWKGGVGAIVDNLPSIKLFLKQYCHKYTMINSTYKKSGIGFVSRVFHLVSFCNLGPCCYAGITSGADAEINIDRSRKI